MPHLKRTLLIAARRTSVLAALLCIGGCSPDTGELIVILPPSRPTNAELLASPRAPTSPSHDGPAPSAVPPDTVALFRALSDSADRLDAIFQRERDALNSEARAMRSGHRTSPEYHSRYQAFEWRRSTAVALREARDRARTGVALIHKRHPELASPPKVTSEGARDSGVVRARADRDTMRLRLAPGAWWVRLAEAPANRAVRVAVRAGVRDTVRLR